MGAAVEDFMAGRDAMLVDRHRGGDQKAFAALYDAHYSQLLGFVRRRVRERDSIEDLTQEAFARAYAAIDGLRDTTRFYPWLTIIARRLIVDHYRGRHRVDPVGDLEVLDERSPDGVVVQRQEQAFMAAALLRLRPRHREVLRLRVAEGLSYDAIAERMGIGASAVPALLHRARAALKREYLALSKETGTPMLVPALLFLADGARRVRDRLAGLVPYLPEPAALTSSMAAMVIGVTAMLAPRATEPHMITQPVPPSGSVVEVLQPTGSELKDVAAVSPNVQPSQRSLAGVAAYRPDPLILDRDGTYAGRDHDREMPYHFEYGDHSISLNPDAMRRDIESSLSGDYRWLEGG